MILGLLTAALLYQPPTADEPTARQLYDDCVRMVAGRAASPDQAEPPLCESSIGNEIAQQAANAAMPETDPGRTRGFCPPDGILDQADPKLPLARAYVTWFERQPAGQHETDAYLAMRRALEETWPCPR